MSRKKKGMSLVEMIAATAIFIIIALAISTTILFSMKINSNNRTKFQSNANSRMFIETQKVNANKPEEYVASTPTTPQKGIKSGNYYLGFDSDVEASNFAKNLSTTVPTKVFTPGEGAPTFTGVTGTSGVITPGDKYAMAVRVEWNDSEKIYIMDIWSWDLADGNSSEVNRRILIAPK